MNKVLLFLFIFTVNFSIAQVKTLIPVDEEVNLPLDSQYNINLSTTLVETRIKNTEIGKNFEVEIKKTLNPNQFYIIEKGSDFIELFIVYPCRSFNLQNIKNQEIITEGLITSSMYFKFRKNEYDIILKDFEWVDKNKNTTDLTKLYHKYLTSEDIKEKVKYYGILKSCEFSIADTYSQITVIIEEMIRQKSLK